MPEPEPQKKNRSWYAWAIGFVVAFGWGLSFYTNQPTKQSVNTGVQVQDKATNARVAIVQQQLDEIMARPNPTTDDYIKNMLDAWVVLDEAKGLVRLQMASVERFKQEHATNSTDAMIADYALRMFEKDEQLLYLMGSEVDCARALESMPRNKRSAYYKDNVLPIKEKEKQAGKEWAAIAKEAEGKGVQWPGYVTKGAKVLE